MSCYLAPLNKLLLAPQPVDPCSSEPSPVYQCKKALRRNMAVKYSATLPGKEAS